ncbi:MAG: DUF2461 domain-containing protein [Muribaculaceae bacterium]|nr:DUF2461 domain-containing protein [Muribaculaceae bacterium]
MKKNPIFDFLIRLRQNNSREWMAGHKAEYQMIMEQRDDVARRFIDAIATIDSSAAGFPVEKCVYRLMRDTRFSADKTPYKTHIGIFVCPPLGKKSLLSGYYLHLEPGASIICGGNYELPTKYLTAIRKDIRDNIEEYLSIVESQEFKRYFPRVGEDWLKTAPKGFSRDWEYIDYVRPRDFGVAMPLPDSFFDNDDFPERLLPMLEQIKRLNDFINFTLTESGFPLLRP